MREGERFLKENPGRVPVVLEKYEGEAENNNLAILEENKWEIFLEMEQKKCMKGCW